MNINTVQDVCKKIEVLFPNLAPFELKKEKLDELVECWKETRDDRYLKHLKQQAVLAEALASIRRKEKANYLNDAKVWSNKK